MLWAQVPTESDSSQIQMLQADSLDLAISDSVIVDSTKGRKQPYGIWKGETDWPRPQKALQLALIPGMGQVYNRNLWKVPIVYAALGTSTYFAAFNHREYARFRDAYRLRSDGDSTTLDEFAGLIPNPESLRALRNDYRQNRDLSIVLGVLGYLGSLMDAYVSAHLTHFDVSDDLTIHVQPPNYWVQGDRRCWTAGLVCTFR